MSNVQSILRSLIVYAICIPLAVYLGYQLSSPGDYGSFFTVALVLGLLSVPLLLRLHYPLMLLSWNMTAVLFFLPGRPQLWLATIAISFAISFSQRILNKEMRAISVPALTWPLIVMALIVLVTAQLRGGIGMRVFGGDVYGGKRYLYIFLSIIGYFALTAQRIPHERATLYVGLFFLGAITAMIGDLYPVLGSIVPFLFWVIPPYDLTSGELGLGIARLSGMTAASAAMFAFMMAKYGIRGIFLAGRPLRMVAFIVFSALGMYGGFRSLLIHFLGVFGLQFFLEGMHRTRLLPAMILGLALTGACTLPFVTKLPPTFQRAMAFLPIPIDPLIRQGAQSSTEWRLAMWKAVLPQVPPHLLLGKGLAMSQQDYGFSVGFDQTALSEDQWGSAMAGDYHNGPLSVLIPFGIWGMIAWIWFLAAGFKVLYLNYRNGDPALRTINTFLFAYFIVKTIMFWLIVGGFYADILTYAGLLGLSVSMNGGVARPVPAPVQEEWRTQYLAKVLPRQRPVFGKQGT